MAADLTNPSFVAVRQKPHSNPRRPATPHPSFYTSGEACPPRASKGRWMSRDPFNRDPGVASGIHRRMSHILATGRGGGMHGPNKCPLAAQSPPHPTVRAYACWNVQGSFSLPALAHPCGTNRQRRFPRIHSGLPIGAPGIAVKQADARILRLPPQSPRNVVSP